MLTSFVLAAVGTARPGQVPPLNGAQGTSGQPATRNVADGGGARRDLSEAEASSVLDLVFAERPHQALRFVDSLETRSSGEPLFFLMRARCNQELIPMDDVGKDAGRELSRPALEDLDRCIQVCTDRIASADADSMLFLYRGWAWMAKAYVRSMTRDLFTAAREAKRGKKDLERYLEMRPGDPTALGMIGAFLYFADTIPSAFKLISKILLLPSGDRTKGLEYLEIAARDGGLLDTDWKLILYNVYFYFEGRWEEGLAGLDKMLDRYPAYARTAIPFAVAKPYAPRLVVHNDEVVDAMIGRIYNGPAREIDWNALYLLQLFRACGDRYCNHSSITAARLRSIVHEAPRHPDWVEGFARFELGRLYASQGKRDDALAMFQFVARGYTFDFLRKEAEISLRDMERFASQFDQPPLPNTDQWVSELYGTNPDSLRAIRPRFERIAARSIAAKFYVAECDLLSGDYESALKGFNEVISIQAPAWDHTFQMIASTRIAEIYAARESYKTAARYEGIALSYYHNEYLLDWVIEGRQSYFERLSEGKETGRPTLLSTDNVSGRNSAPVGDRPATHTKDN
jgi:tetratricopeptide (TPR) repeat protein